jgi:hypothetical protein
MITIEKIQRCISKYKIKQAGENMFCFTKRYREIRQHMRYKGNQCFICGHKFEDNEKFGLMITDKGNKTICNECAGQIQQELK